jgi:hypothetical protein
MKIFSWDWKTEDGEGWTFMPICNFGYQTISVCLFDLQENPRFTWRNSNEVTSSMIAPIYQTSQTKPKIEGTVPGFQRSVDPNLASKIPWSLRSIGHDTWWNLRSLNAKNPKTMMFRPKIIHAWAASKYAPPSTIYSTLVDLTCMFGAFFWVPFSLKWATFMDKNMDLSAPNLPSWVQLSGS